MSLDILTSSFRFFFNVSPNKFDDCYITKMSPPTVLPRKPRMITTAPVIRSPIAIALEKRKKRLAEQPVSQKEDYKEQAKPQTPTTKVLPRVHQKRKREHSTTKSLATSKQAKTSVLSTIASHKQEDKKRKKEGATTFLSLPRELRQSILHQTLPLSALGIPNAPRIDYEFTFGTEDLLRVLFYSSTSSDGTSDEFTAECRQAREGVWAWARILSRACEDKVLLLEDIDYVRECWLKEADEKIAERRRLWVGEIGRLRAYTGGVRGLMMDKGENRDL